jgi:hypothetical protein
MVRGLMETAVCFTRFTKSYIAVMNYTEMEAKVREATNNEPWGASSTRQS